MRRLLLALLMGWLAIGLCGVGVAFTAKSSGPAGTPDLFRFFLVPAGIWLAAGLCGGYLWRSQSAELGAVRIAAWVLLFGIVSGFGTFILAWAIR